VSDCYLTSNSLFVFRGTGQKPLGQKPPDKSTPKNKVTIKKKDKSPLGQKPPDKKKPNNDEK
jgi:hypothetical protein